MIARFIWIVALSAVALITSFVQLDRQSQKTPSLSSSVPGIFRSSAQRNVTVSALRENDPGAALEQAKKLVWRRPMPAEHLRYLAQAQFAANELEAGALSIQYAAQRGWRDRLSQQAMMQLALTAGDSAEAARRFTALLLSRRSDDTMLREAGLSVFAPEQDAARGTVADILAGTARWHNPFLQRGMAVIPTEAFAEIVLKAFDSGSDYDCGILARVEPRINSRDASVGADFAQKVAEIC